MYGVDVRGVLNVINISCKGLKPEAAAAAGAGGAYSLLWRYCVRPWFQYDSTLHGNRLPVSPHTAQGRGPASGMSSWAAARQPWLSMATAVLDGPKVATLAT